ncbi:hypothetical protein Mgra_00008549 [Meloidogyne graminicola]|uniref:Uncharacterized protein n=1 Tax=Meloidogyne graminicola TaxID=189291 RepID=A0A8S9ZFE9_9BILA|nr:hypothetical protein Mgra_00008549 [Meloidogyne graminicola]
MEDENEQLDYDELDDLETARKKCKQLQKAVEIDTLQAVKTSSEQQTIEEVKEILTNDSTIKSETVPITSQMQLSSFPQAIPQYTCSTSLFSSTSSVLYSSSTPPPPGVSTVPIIASSFSPPITTNILRPSIQQQPFLNKFYVNPKFNNNKNFRFDKRNMSKTFHTNPIGVGYFPSISALPPTANVLTSQPGGTVQFVGGVYKQIIKI